MRIAFLTIVQFEKNQSAFQRCMIFVRDHRQIDEQYRFAISFTSLKTDRIVSYWSIEGLQSHIPLFMLLNDVVAYRIWCAFFNTL